jgi:hypothetical protein
LNQNLSADCYQSLTPFFGLLTKINLYDMYGTCESDYGKSLNSSTGNKSSTNVTNGTTNATSNTTKTTN